MEILATSRVQVSGPQRGKRVLVRGKEGETSLAVAFIRRSLSLASIKAQSHSLLGRLEGMGGGTAAAAGRRSEALQVEVQEMKECEINIPSRFIKRFHVSYKYIKYTKP